MESFRIKDLSEEDRPREKLLQRGPGALTDSELLAIFLRTGIQGKSAIDVGRELLREFHGLSGIAKADVKRLSSIKGLGPAKASLLVATLELSKRLATQQMHETPPQNPEQIADYLRPRMSHLSEEHLHVILLNTKNRLIAEEVISKGILNETLAHPREILRPCLIHRAYAFVLAHNHPSGDPTPSTADRTLTTRIHEGAELLGIKMLDHLIIGRPRSQGPDYFSFREHGLL